MKKDDKKDKKPELNMIQLLEQLGKVEVINDNLLIFTKVDGEGVYLRYSIGNTFSFLKGSLPFKIQIRKGFETDMDKFKEKLIKIIQDEIEDGSKVKELHLGSKYLAEQLESFKKNELLKKFDIRFALKGNRLEYEGGFYRILVNHKKEVVYMFNNHFMAIKNDIGSTLDIVVKLSEEIEKIKESIVV